jgi:hypothetical protein
MKARFAPNLREICKVGIRPARSFSRICAQSANQSPFRIQLTSDMDVKLRFSKWKQTFFSRPPGGVPFSPEIPHSLKPSRDISGAGSGIRTHEGVMPNGCHFNSPTHAPSGSQGRRFNHSAIPARSRIQVKETFHLQLT